MEVFHVLAETIVVSANMGCATDTINAVITATKTQSFVKLTVSHIVL